MSDSGRIWYKLRGALIAPVYVIAMVYFGYEQENWLIYPLGGALFTAGWIMRVWSQMHLHYRLKVHKVLTKTGPFDYHVSIHHFDNLEDYFVHPIPLTEPLPEIFVPLLPGDGAVALDLQQVFQRTYEAGPYVREIDYVGDPEFCETATGATGTVSAIGTVGNVVKDPRRLELVADVVHWLYHLHESPDAAAMGLGPRPEAAASPKYPAGEVRMHGILVFAEHRNYLPLLRNALLQRFAPGDIDVPELEGAELLNELAVNPLIADDFPEEGEVDGKEEEDDEFPVGEPEVDMELAPVVLRGGASRETLTEAHAARIVLTTYGYCRRGVSITEMTAMVLATPRRNGLRQIKGRITRRGSDESIRRVIVDIRDVNTVLKGQSSNRRAVYKEVDYPITKSVISHEEVAPGVVSRAEEKAVWTPEDG